MLKRLSILMVVFVALLPPGADARQSAQTIDIPGLQAPVEVVFDQMGIPHIYASNSHDLFLAQGYVEATHRWWQMEWQRRLASGRLSELAGESYVQSDTYYRTLGFEYVAALDLAVMSDETRVVLEAYSDGVNAYLRDKTPEEAAIEYRYLAHKPDRVEDWTVFDSIVWQKSMSERLSMNYVVEIARAALLEEVGPMGAVLIPPYPYGEHPVITEPGEIDYRQSSAVEQSSMVVLPGGYQPGIGSNSWVVSGDLTDTGLPMLANDPHLSIQLPSIWYEIGLHCVEVSEVCPFDMVGFSFTGTPGIAIGHNQHIAWGATNVGADVQDLYIIRLNPNNSLQYLFNGDWVDFEVADETITVAGGDAVEVQVLNSVWGPVISDPDDKGRVLALRWTSLEANTAFDAFLLLNKARNWEEFREAMRYFDAPVQNIVYADIEGNIGYQMPGSIPLRAEGHDGTVPIDGSTDQYAWQGSVPFEELPSLYNPDAGYIVSANNAVVGEDYPYPIIDVFSFGWRAKRIEMLLQQLDVITLDDMTAIQGDNYNQKADFLIPVLQEIEIDDPTLNEAVEWLAVWDRQNDMESSQAALFETFWQEFLTRAIVDEFGVIPAGGGDMEWYLVRLLIDVPRNFLWDDRRTPDVTETRDDLMRAALEQAWERMVEDYGDDPERWAWGDLHIARFVGPPQVRTTPEADALFRVEVRTAGGNSIINSTGWNVGASFDVIQVPSMRVVMNVADWDTSIGVNSLGQSGKPDDPHFRDQVDLWRHHEYRPVWFSREQTLADAEMIWNLVPLE